MYCSEYIAALSACPACPVGPEDRTGVGPEDRTGVGPEDRTGVSLRLQKGLIESLGPPKNGYYHVKS